MEAFLNVPFIEIFTPFDFLSFCQFFKKHRRMRSLIFYHFVSFLESMRNLSANIGIVIFSVQTPRSRFTKFGQNPFNCASAPDYSRGRYVGIKATVNWFVLVVSSARHADPAAKEKHATRPSKQTRNEIMIAFRTRDGIPFIVFQSIFPIGSLYLCLFFLKYFLVKQQNGLISMEYVEGKIVSNQLLLSSDFVSILFSDFVSIYFRLQS